ncbi:hypothetical protein CTKZ_08620 [Cellulomonas algicola]|uniref:Uncharacterized protein n=1 Tax=Cellulomonas algicola TaxID=2071633 RepID=A0A401UXN8_9CELL|nr:hypothetical protein [Cellulomonas algicola]GCD19300.1 hypothetical protein CTKZ_08620 [Cellulomonas algicola]
MTSVLDPFSRSGAWDVVTERGARHLFVCQRPNVVVTRWAPLTLDADFDRFQRRDDDGDALPLLSVHYAVGNERRRGIAIGAPMRLHILGRGGAWSLRVTSAVRSIVEMPIDEYSDFIGDDGFLVE